MLCWWKMQDHQSWQVQQCSLSANHLVTCQIVTTVLGLLALLVLCYALHRLLILLLRKVTHETGSIRKMGFTLRVKRVHQNLNDQQLQICKGIADQRENFDKEVNNVN